MLSLAAAPPSRQQFNFDEALDEFVTNDQVRSLGRLISGCRLMSSQLQPCSFGPIQEALRSLEPLHQHNC